MPLSRPPILAAIAIGLLAAAHVSATALTAMLAANDRSCYYADVDGLGEKVGACLLHMILRQTRAYRNFIHFRPINRLLLRRAVRRKLRN